MRSQGYQIALIFLGVMGTVFFTIFLYREIYPEYRIYQNDYIALESFRSSYTKEPPPSFETGVKQIIFEREDKGPALIDRCTSCHVAVELPHFSSTKIAYDINGNIIRSADGTPEKIPNENYIWAKLDEKIAELRDLKVNQQLEKQRESSKLQSRLKEAQDLESLKVANVGGHVYDVTKVLSMHPLIGKETRPFEFHPADDYGCTSCHGGNGRALTTQKAHGPVFDGQYEVEYRGPTPQFTQQDANNDPLFAKLFNDKPGEELIFQTSPILVGNLIQANCVQCHLQTTKSLQGLAGSIRNLASENKKMTDTIKLAYEDEKEALLSYILLKNMIIDQGYKKTIDNLQKHLEDQALSQLNRSRLLAQLGFLQKEQEKQKVLDGINKKIEAMLGSENLFNELEKLSRDYKPTAELIDEFLTNHLDIAHTKGSLFKKREALKLQESLLAHIQDTEGLFVNAADNANVMGDMNSDINWLTRNYQRGQQLYLSQACYACHKIAGFSRGGVGPELTKEGTSYPWFIKESIVWPQADLRTSTMPNYSLDHIELEDLMTYLLAQKGPTKAVSQTEYKIAIQEWENSRKMPWETPIPPSEVYDLRSGMIVFATQGCAACHRLEGFESDVGFRIEKDPKLNFHDLYNEREWFRSVFPEEILGSTIVKALETYSEEIDNRIVDHVRTGSILEEIQEKYPDTIEAFYSNFRFAARGKNRYFRELENNSSSQEQKEEVKDQSEKWKKRVHRVLMMYIQEYGLGRLIGPKPNWSGVYRSDEWLMEHFHNPSAHVPRSIMPIFPFDDTKFYALTNMLDILAKRNRDRNNIVWKENGFNPGQAYQIYCSECHGENRQGNGPVATWIYPVPKNLLDVEFLRNLTRENAIQSIKHGVKGTPMPPWGETPKDKKYYDGIPILSEEEISLLVDWLFSSIPGGAVIKDVKDVPKWNYSPSDVLRELRQEGKKLKPENSYEGIQSSSPSGEQFSDLAFRKNFNEQDGEFQNRQQTFYVATQPKIDQSNYSAEVSDVFDIIPNPFSEVDTYNYYIKKKYYTQDNLNKGKQFFELNCAICHGSEADGSGIRASIMVNAKPRMLTNLDWIKTRDDLRLLRSIKYGVPGTAMTPWGDLTSSLQRLQLVMYIRSLSVEKDKRESFAEALYQTFEEIQMTLEKERSKEYLRIIETQNESRRLEDKQKALVNTTQAPLDKEESFKLYSQILELSKKIKQSEVLDQNLVQIKQQVGEIRRIFQLIGNDMLIVNVPDEIWKSYLETVRFYQRQFLFDHDQLILNPDPKIDEEIGLHIKQIVMALDLELKALENKKIVIGGKLPSTEKDEELKAVNSKSVSYAKLKNKLLSGLEQIKIIQNQLTILFREVNEGMDTKQKT